MTTYAATIFCVLGLAIGQILFKISAISLAENGSLFSFKPAAIFFAAMCLYGATSAVWVWVLQKIELGRVYPLMALAFIIVPIGSHFFLGEKFAPQYFIGVTLIVIGIIVAVKA